jgi:hypothetical protein
MGVAIPVGSGAYALPMMYHERDETGKKRVASISALLLGNPAAQIVDSRRAELDVRHPSNGLANARIC